jgi:hypothetical protein
MADARCQEFRSALSDNRGMGLKRFVLIILMVLLVLVFVLYRSRQASRGLNVDPHAAREIERAKRR